MDILQVKNHLMEKSSDIEVLLNKVGFHSIRESEKEFRCAYEEGGNPTSVQINKESLFCNCFSKGIKGDIFVLLAHNLNYDMPRSLPLVIKYVCDSLGIEYGNSFKPKENIKYPFGGHYRAIKKSPSYNVGTLPTYDNKIIDDYELCVNRRFLIDGISEESHIKYDIGYDVLTQRITVPWRTPLGEICGIMGRLNFDGEEDMPKWFPILPFKKSLTLFGYYQNYSAIQEKGMLFIGESEKFTMQLDSMDIDVSVSLGGSNISTIQANLIKSLRPSTIIACFDEGLDESYIIDQAKKLKSDNPFYRNKVGYIFDTDNRYLPLGSKASPSDYGKDIFETLVDNCIKWL